MTCVPLTCSQALAADCLLISFLGTRPSSQLSGTSTVVPFSKTEPRTDGFRGSRSTAATSESSTLHPGAVEWIASQRASLARIFQRLEGGQVSEESGADFSSRSCEQLTLFGPPMCSSRTRPTSEPRAAMLSSLSSWRADTPGATEKLERLPLALPISEIGGFALLPTLTAVPYGYNQGGAQGRVGKKRYSLGTLLPTLTADVMKQSPTSEYQNLTKKLSELCASTHGQMSGRGLLSETVAEWFMGFPLNHTASRRWVTRKSRSKRQRHG